MGQKVFWDIMAPKKQAEFLIYGSAYSVKCMYGLGVSVKVGKDSKILIVYGDRTWTHNGISRPKPFKTMPLNYANSYGGYNYIFNPLGKGHIDKELDEVRLPNIEHLNQLILDQSDVPQPAGFGPYPSSWPQRKKYFPNSYDFENEETPIIINDNSILGFNTAPLDQQIEGFFQGDENIEINNMHPIFPVISSSLPGIRLRRFILIKNKDNIEKFEEIETYADTLWLLPDLESGILSFHSNYSASEFEFTNITCVYSAIEYIEDDPKPLKYYLDNFLGSRIKLILLDYPINNSILSHKVKASSSNTNSNSEVKCNLPHLDSTLLSTHVENTSVNKLLNKFENINNGKEDAFGLSSLLNYIPIQMKAIMEQFNISEQDIDEYNNKRAREGLSLYPTSSEIIHELRSDGIKDPQLEEAIYKNFDLLKSLNNLETI